MIQQIRKLNKKRLVSVVAGFVIGLLLLLNHFAYVVNKGKVLPNTSVNGIAVNGSIDHIYGIDSKTIELRYNDQSQKTNLKSLKISTNSKAIADEIAGSHEYIRSIALFLGKHTYALELDADHDVLKEELDKLFEISLAPTDPALSFEDGVAQVKQGAPGRVVDTDELLSKIKSASVSGELVDVPVKPIEPQANPDLNATAESVNAKLEKAVTIKSSKGNYVATKADKVSWVAFDGLAFSFDAAKILITLRQVQFVKSAKWSNINAAATQIAKDLGANKDSTVTVTDALPTALKTITYCVQLKNVNTGELAGFKSKVAQVLADSRGWSLGGKVRFAAVDSGCQFIAWLSAPNDVAAFSPTVCDNYYSCRVGNNVIINYDRWVGATDPWNAAGGSLSDYRSMVINHEVGHWLGFGHSNCPGAGTPAPVMQQQSISLQGCSFNPWPTQTELVSLANKYGL